MITKLNFRASTSVRLNFLSILHEKTYFFYFTHPLLQNTHISLSILHIYSIKYSFFYYFLLFSSHPSHSLPISLSQTNRHHQATNLHHHQPIQPNIINSPGHINPHTRNPIQPKRKPNQPKYPKSHSTQMKAKSTPFNPKPTDQTTRNKGKQLDLWRDQRLVAMAIDGSGGERFVHCFDLMEKMKKGERQLDRSWSAWLEGMMKHLCSWWQVWWTWLAVVKGLMISGNGGMVWPTVVVWVRTNEEKGEWGEVRAETRRESGESESEGESRDKREKKLLKN